MITKQLVQKFVQKTLKDLKGDWVIIGGTVLPLVGVEYRQTVDIDMLPMAGHDNDTMLALMEVADSLGMPVEAVNSAGLFFLKKIDDWQNRLTLHAESKKCRVYRPSFDLYLELKLARFSESDESDVHAYLAWHQQEKIDFKPKESARIVQSFVTKSKDAETRERLQKLRSKLD